MSIAIDKVDPIVELLSQDLAFVVRIARRAIATVAEATVAALLAPSPHSYSRLDDLYTREGIRLMAVW